jgi:predicted nuclease of restriction endonuclease-like RecB superfamily
MENLEKQEWDYKFCKTVGEMFGVTPAEVKHMVFKVYDDNIKLKQMPDNNVGGRTM